MKWWLSEIIIQTICSFIIIFIGHQLYDFIKDNFTKKVVKDMYYTQVEKYQEIIAEIQNEDDMETELNQFLEESILTSSPL